MTCALATSAYAVEAEDLPVVLPSMATVLEGMLGPHSDQPAQAMRVSAIAINRSAIRVTYANPDAEVLLEAPGSQVAADARTSKFDVRLVRVAPEARGTVLATLTQRLNSGQANFAWHVPPPRVQIPQSATPEVRSDDVSHARSEPPVKAALLTPLQGLAAGVVLAFFLVVVLAWRVRSLRKPLALGLPVVLLASLVIPVPRSDGNAAAVDFDAELGWSPIHADDEWPTGPKPPKTWGQRPVAIDPHRKHIVILGDSVGYGWGLADNETIDFHLQKAFPEYQVVNLSVTGWAPDQEYLYFLRALPLLKPHLVLMLVFVGNDVPGLELASFYGHAKPLLAAQGDKITRLNPDLRRLSCIDVLSKSVALHFFWAAGKAGKGEDRETVSLVLDAVCRSESTSRQQAATLMSAIVRDAEALSRARGAEFVTVLMPTSAQRSAEPLVDPAEQIRADTGESVQSWRDLLFFRKILLDGHHESLEVHRWMNEDFPWESGHHFKPGEKPPEAKELFLDGGHLDAPASAWLAKRFASWIRARPAPATAPAGH